MPDKLLGFKQLEKMLIERGANETMTIAYKLDIEKHLRVKRQDRQRSDHLMSYCQGIVLFIK